LIDFEYAFTGPLYFLYEYPIFIQDVSWSEELYTENAILRTHFVQAIHGALPDAKAQSTFIASINQKCFALNGFRDAFMTMKCSEATFAGLAKNYVQDVENGTGLAYSGRLDYTPEQYNEAAEPLHSKSSVQSGALDGCVTPGSALQTVGGSSRDVASMDGDDSEDGDNSGNGVTAMAVKTARTDEEDNLGLTAPDTGR
jgi:hypothetical protein